MEQLDIQPWNFTGLHQGWLFTLQEASEHVNFQIPTKHLGFSFHIYNISNKETDVCTAIATVWANNNGMRNDSKKPAAFLITMCPYGKHWSANITNTRNP